MPKLCETNKSYGVIYKADERKEPVYLTCSHCWNGPQQTNLRQYQQQSRRRSIVFILNSACDPSLGHPRPSQSAKIPHMALLASSVPLDHTAIKGREEIFARLSETGTVGLNIVPVGRGSSLVLFFSVAPLRHPAHRHGPAHLARADPGSRPIRLQPPMICKAFGPLVNHTASLYIHTQQTGFTRAFVSGVKPIFWSTSHGTSQSTRCLGCSLRLLIA